MTYIFAMNVSPHIKLKNGFTAIELLIVVFIVSLISMVSYPYLNRTYEDYSLYREVTAIKDGLELARSYSVRYNSIVNIIFNAENQKFSCFEDLNNDGKLNGSDKVLWEHSIRKGIDMYEAKFGSGSTLAFDQSGNSSHIGHVYLRKENNYRAVFIRSLAGNIASKKSLDGGETWE